MLDNPTTLAATYARDGFLCPIRALSEAAASAHRDALEAAEREARSIGQEQVFRRYSNVVLDFVDSITRLPAVTDPVAAILGPDLLVLECSFFIKEARTPSYVSWHQDLHYWGLEGDDEVTAWVALSPANRASGCMKFVPGSHRQVAEHRDTFHEDNLLTRGQEIAVEVDEAEAVAAELAPGEMSLHHGRLFHASDPNGTDDRRIGLAIRYIPTSMRQAVGGRMAATLVRGEDRHGNFDLIEAPRGVLDPHDLARHQDISERRRRVMMRDTGDG